MKWVMLLVAVVLGAGITWLLTVKQVSSTAAPAPVSEVPRDDEAWDDEARDDEAAGFGGPATDDTTSELGWDRGAQDEDALMPHGDAQDSREAHPSRATEGRAEATPIAAATPNGDLAGVIVARPTDGADAGPDAQPDSGPGAGPFADRAETGEAARSDDGGAGTGTGGAPAPNG